MSGILLPACVVEYADQALEKLRRVSGQDLSGWNGLRLLEERSRLMGLRSQSLQSANGSCHLWQSHDLQWIALNLSRPQDWELLPALFQENQAINDLQKIGALVKQRDACMLLTQGRQLGLAIAGLETQIRQPATEWFSIAAQGPYKTKHDDNPCVLDLSALWAGPLCSYLLQQGGARVIKVESVQRPDGTRLNHQPGADDFYQGLNRHKELVVLDFKSSADLKQLKQLIDAADIVIEASRPRALRQLGISAEQIIRAQAGKIWISITGYGRTEPEANWIAYGDDAAISAGLFQFIDNQPAFIGDAIADPLTGLHAALAAYEFWKTGVSVLLDINLHTVAKHCATHCTNPAEVFSHATH